MSERVYRQTTSGILSKKIARGIINNIAWVILILLVFVSYFTIDGFTNVNNLINILHHSIFIGILAISQTFVLISGNMDLSVESTAAFTCMLSVWLAGSSLGTSGLLLNTWLVFAIAIAVGISVGVINAFFIVNLKVNSFLVTLATYIAVRSLIIFIIKGVGMHTLPNDFTFINKTRIIGIPLIVFVTIFLFIIFEFVLRSTSFGRHIYVIGGDIKTAYSFGIRVNRTLYQIYILSGAIAGLGGWLLASRLNGSTTSVASGLLFMSIAAVVIGGVSLSGGYGNLISVFAGVLTLAVIQNVLNLAAVSPLLTGVVQGGIILVAVSLDSIKRFLK